LSPLAYDPESATTITNPTVVVEVLSPSTEEYDRQEKVAHYLRILSLRACILAGHDRRALELWFRTSDSPWEHRELGPGERLRVPLLETELDVDRLYDDAGVAAAPHG
jgi:Uma2 family endonuclease